MKTILTLLLCISLVAAQQNTSPVSSKTKDVMAFRLTLKKWQEKLKQYNTPELRKLQKYTELRKEMKKELRDIRQRKTSEPAPVMQKQSDKKAETKSIIQTYGLQNKHVMQVDTLQQRKPSSTVVPEKVIEAVACYDVPFASKGNTIDLSIANSSTLAEEEVKVEAMSIPEGIRFIEKIVSLGALNPKEEQIASFSFSVEKTATVNKEQTLSFSITDKSGQRWTKEIAIKVSAPKTYELFQNYPNPFNPTTVIEYQLPGVGTRYIVSLRIYDVLGREVANLVNEQQEPGGHQATFSAAGGSASGGDARKIASGMYIYRLIATDELKNYHVFQKKMLVLK